MLRIILILAVVFGVVYYFFPETIQNISGKITDRYQSNVQETHELSN